MISPNWRPSDWEDYSPGSEPVKEPRQQSALGIYLLGFRSDSKELGCLMNPMNRKKNLSKHGKLAVTMEETLPICLEHI